MILVIEINDVNVRIVSSNNYVPGDEFELANFFNIDYDEHWFPYNILSVESLHYYGPIPTFTDFILHTDNENRITKKKLFYNSKQKFTKKAYCLSKELIIHADLKLWLLTSAMLQFLKESFELQHCIQSSFVIDNIDRQTEDIKGQFVNPFNSPNVSLGGLMYNIYRYNYLNFFDIYSIKNEYGTKTKTVSRIEHQFTSFMHYMHSEDDNFMSAFSSNDGQKYFRESIPDLYCTKTKTCYFLMGCAFHGHYNGCLLNPNATAETVDPFGNTYGDLNEKFNTKIDNLILNNPDDVKEIILEYECTFKNRMLTNPDVINFLQNHYVYHPLTRLQPRSAMRFSLIDTFAMKWSAEQFPDENFYALDCNGLFSYCAMYYPYMIGKYEIIIGKALGNLTFVDNELFYCGQKIMGSIFLKILPPKSLKYPFLLYRIGDLSYATLCCKCAELESKNYCKHSNEERALIGTYMISEIEYSLKIGYTILEVFEVHGYFKFDFIMEPFIRLLNLLKTKSCDIPQTCTTQAEKTLFCQNINEQLKLHSSQQLTPKSFKPNNAKRNFYKLAANTFFGKFSQRSDHSKVVFVHTQQELEKYFFQSKINDITCISELVCMIQYSSAGSKLPPNLKHNVYIGAQITANGRQIMHEHLMTLYHTANCTVYHINCDSIYFTLPKDVSIPLKIDSVIVGSFKNVYDGDIINYISFGPRQYCVNFLKNEKVLHQACISGLSIQHSMQDINFDSIFKTLSKKHEEMLIHKFIFPQTRKKISLKNLTVNFYTDKFTLNNSFTTKRNISLHSDRIVTLPYGYKYPDDEC